MYFTGTENFTDKTPKWVYELIDEIEHAGDFCTNTTYFKQSPKEYQCGWYLPHKNACALYMKAEKTLKGIWIVCHEMAHAWQHLEGHFSLTITPKHKRNVWHNRAFFEYAKHLYAEYGVLDYALDHEYKTGRKILAEV